ncbi:alpha/beta hydrolase [Clostridium oceanicum]|uniref:Alpha/beta hydrolase n=1 Tax=Clostridium oceanicum TaxID=1543 RepID=A0ABN1JUM1_9CLOT
MIEYKIQKKKKSKYNKLIIGFVSLLLFIFLSMVGISIYVGWNLTKPKRDIIKSTPKKYGLIYEDISFQSNYDKTKLKGWWIPAQKSKKVLESKKTVVFSHGYGDNRGLYDISVINLAKRLAKEGYNVFTFDFRGSGESEGDFVSIGQFEKYDLLSAIDFVKKDKKSTDINLMGWSMGAVASILAGEESKDINKVVADSPFANLKDYLKKNLPYWSHLPKFPFTDIILACLPTLRGIDINKVNATKAANNFKDKRLFLIHSKDDKAIPYENSEIIYNEVNNKDNVQAWFTNKADHIKSYLLYKKEYEEKVISFLNNNK